VTFELLVHDWALRGATLLDAIAAIIVILAALRAAVMATLAMAKPYPASRLSPVRRRFAVWLALSLEILIGSDIVRTAVSPNWTDIAQLGAIVALRIIINYTLLQDINAGE
jgi:uncharacterized membrane protein